MCINVGLMVVIVVIVVVGTLLGFWQKGTKKKQKKKKIGCKNLIVEYKKNEKEKFLYDRFL